MVLPGTHVPHSTRRPDSALWKLASGPHLLSTNETFGELYSGDGACAMLTAVLSATNPAAMTIARILTISSTFADCRNPIIRPSFASDTSFLSNLREYVAGTDLVRDGRDRPREACSR